MKHLQAVAYVSAYDLKDYMDWAGEDIFPIYGFDAVCQLPDTAVVFLEDNHPLCVIRESCYNDIETIFEVIRRAYKGENIMWTYHATVAPSLSFWDEDIIEDVIMKNELHELKLMYPTEILNIEY